MYNLYVQNKHHTSSDEWKLHGYYLMMTPGTSALQRYFDTPFHQKDAFVL
jgi:hypothetical protein